jgi:hypothetical protein
VDVTVDQQEVDDTDNLNEAEEYEGWKLRELLRIRRYAIEYLIIAIVTRNQRIYVKKNSKRPNDVER